MAGKKIIVIGAGGHGKVVLDALLVLGENVMGLVDSLESLHGLMLFDVKVLGGDSVLGNLSPETVQLANGVGGARSTTARRKVYDMWIARGFAFTGLVHPRACIGRDVRLGAGVQIMAGAVVQAGATIGDNSIINTSASVDHDCVIGPHCHLAPGVVLSGGVTIDEGTHIGTGACIVQGVRVGKNAFVAAGAVVTADVDDNACVRGVPAAVYERRS